MAEKILSNIQYSLREIQELGQKVLVVGLGISGLESIKFCLRNEIKTVAVEREAQELFMKKSRYKQEVEELLAKGVEIHFGVDGERLVKILEGVKLAILSPGVPLESAVCAVLRRYEVPFICELELGIELQNNPSIVVTGSNGKSTTVSLIDAIFRHAGWNSRLCGNVGIPVIAGTEDLKGVSATNDKSLLVVEASSYQLETCTLLKPRVAALLNISENHLERHGDINRYLKIKSKVFQRQDASDLAILNADDPRIAKIASEISSKVAAFGIQDHSDKYSRYARVEYSPACGVDRVVFGNERYDLAEAKLKGLHNRFNFAVAIIAARELGVAKEVVQEAISVFESLEHRLEYVGKVREIDCFNDSKSTTVAASMAALATLLGDGNSGKITLMLGGLSKAGSWDPLCKQIVESLDKLNSVICFGKDSGLIANYCKTFKIPHLTSPNLAKAVESGFIESQPGDVILFSPGCASFDEFNDFEERGRAFKNLTLSV